MENSNNIVVWMASNILRSGDYEIEASTLEAIAQDADAKPLEVALQDASKSEQRGGAFGMEILGSVLIPVIVSAASQFWSAYQKRIAEKLGVSAADATIEQVKKWFAHVSDDETQEVSEVLATMIRKVGTERGLASQDIEALVVAITPAQLSSTLEVKVTTSSFPR